MLFGILNPFVIKSDGASVTSINDVSEKFSTEISLYLLFILFE